MTLQIMTLTSSYNIVSHSVKKLVSYSISFSKHQLQNPMDLFVTIPLNLNKQNEVNEWCDKETYIYWIFSVVLITFSIKIDIVGLTMLIKLYGDEGQVKYLQVL